MRRALPKRGRYGLRDPARKRALALFALLMSACASVSDGASAQVAGCYQFQRDAGARTLGLPWGFVLHDQELEGDWPLAANVQGLMRAETATSASARADHPFGYWRWTAPDSVEIGYPGSGGFTLTLGVDGQDLVGAGRAVGDVLRPGEPAGPRPAQPVVARRVLCGAS